MCGIIGYVGNKNFVSVAKKCLLNLEYRGYDSAGISLIKEKSIITFKKQGDVKNLFKYVPKHIEAFCGIGHTRWATHGKVCDENAHPHMSYCKTFSLVHNGMIDNYQEIKNLYLKDIPLKSETDTEVLVNLIEVLYKKNNNINLTLQQVLNIVKGTFAFALLFNKENNKIYFGKNQCPMILANNENEYFLCSDINACSENIKTYGYVNDYCYGFITKNTYKVFNSSGKEQSISFINAKKSNLSSNKKEYPHYMLKEIFETKNVIIDTIDYYLKKQNDLTNIPNNFFNNINQVYLIACGTSNHSSMIGEKYFEHFKLCKAKAIIASEFLYNEVMIDKNTLCIFISQSGETADVLTSIKKANRLGAKTLSITNVANSSIYNFSNHTILTIAGQEVSVASTKAYCAQLTLLYILTTYLANSCNINKELLKQLKKSAKKLNINKIESQIKKLATQFVNYHNIYFVGKNYDYITALETCLKIKEITYIPCDAYPAGELKHGTLALIEKQTPVVAIITEKDKEDKTMAIINQTSSRGAKTYLFSSSTKDCFYKLIDCDEILFSPILNIIPFQMLSYYIATMKGNNPDRPRNLAKSVTVE